MGKYGELIEMHNSVGNDELRSFKNSLRIKERKALIHAEQAVSVILNMYHSSNEIDISNPEWKKAALTSEAEAEACAQVLHSLADNIAQVINISVLSGHLSEERVSIRLMRRILEDEGLAPEVLDPVKCLLESQEFKYIGAFCNTIKHRRLLDTEYYEEFGVDTRNEEGIRFREFLYRGEKFPTTWSSDICDNYRRRIIELIGKIDDAINAYSNTKS